MAWTIEPHGPEGTYALYSGRDDQHHGLRLCNLSDFDADMERTCRLITAIPELLAAAQAVLAVEAVLYAAIEKAVSE